VANKDGEGRLPCWGRSFSTISIYSLTARPSGSIPAIPAARSVKLSDPAATGTRARSLIGPEQAEEEFRARAVTQFRRRAEISVAVRSLKGHSVAERNTTFPELIYVPALD
jgi:hypothetical protein